jgi:ABC-2 type transport system ATP-binding protein
MLELRGVSKRFRGIPAIEDVSFTVRPGEVTGYLGPNGSGKSTTIKIITGLLEPSEGKVFWKGRDTSEDPISFRSILGYVPEEPDLYAHLSGLEYLEMMGQLREIPPRVFVPRIDRFLKEFGLWEDRWSPMSSYSKGMRQKVLISASLLHDPELVLFDEPMSGLDVHTALVVRELIQKLASAGKTVLFSSHELDTVEKASSRVVILYRGSVVANDDIARLREYMSLPSLEAIFRQLAAQADPERAAGAMMEVLSR